MTLFDGLRASLDDLLGGRVPPAHRADQLQAMKDGLVRARMATEDLRGHVAQTRTRLDHERRELATVQRRRELAAGIGDAETVAVAERFAAQHAERVAVLERKLAVQEEEAALAEREVAEMTAQLKAAAAGVGDGPAPRAPRDADLGLPDEAPLRQELDGLRRAAAEADAEARLAALKRRMGR
jgi:phage shock protein A